MAKVGVSVKDATGTTKAMLYEDSNATGLQQAVEVVSISGSVVPGVGATNLGKAEDSVHASGDVGVMALAVRTDTPATSSSGSGDYEPLHLSAQGALWTTPTPTTVGGLSMTRVLSAANTNATLVKSSASNLYGIWVSNTSTSTRWLKLYNMTAAPTVGSSVPVMTIAIPSGFCGDLNVGTHGISFTAGISLAITGAYTDADTTAVVAGDVCLNILYK